MRQQVRQARHHLVGGLQKRQQLARRACDVDRREVVFAALAQLRAQLAHRPRGSLNDEHDHPRDHEHKHGLAPQRVDQDLAGQGLPQFQRLGDLDRRHAAPFDAGHGLQEDRHAHRLVAVAVVVEVDQRRVGALGWQGAAPGRQVLEAGHHLAAEAAHLVEDAAAVVGFERFERRIQHRAGQARRVAAARDFELFADSFGAGQQRAVVGGVGRAQRLAVQAHRVDRDEGQHRQQDAEQQVAAQRQGLARAPVHEAAFSR